MGPLPSWSESFATGDPVIDAQHRDLLALVAKLDEVVTARDGGRSPYLYMLDRVLEFTWTHFDMEEALMTRVAYPLADHVEMTQQHTEFKSYARIRVMEFQFRQATELKSFAPFIQNWLVEHEFGLDRRLADFIRNTSQTVSAHAGGSDQRR